MASEKLLQAMQGVRSTNPYLRKTNIGNIPTRAEINLQPLDTIQSDEKPSLDTTVSDPMGLEEVKVETNLPKFHVDQTAPKQEILSSPDIYPKQEPYSIIPKEEDIVFDWNDIEDRRILLDAQLEAESRYNPQAGSHKGAQGIAQFMPGTWADYQKKGWVPKDKTPYDVGAALQGQRKYMERMFGRDLVSQHPDSLTQIKMALAGYNAGPQSVINAFRAAKEQGTPDKWMQYLPRKEETIPYINRILDTARSHKEKNYDPKYDWGYRRQGGILNTTKS